VQSAARAAFKPFYFKEIAQQTISISPAFPTEDDADDPAESAIAIGRPFSGWRQWALMIIKTTRFGFLALVAIVQSVAICGDAVAKPDRSHLHLHRLALKAHAEAIATGEQARPGSLRYYGGPKSPMWRSSAEN
jgi:hypothetical protein